MAGSRLAVERKSWGHVLRFVGPKCPVILNKPTNGRDTNDEFLTVGQRAADPDLPDARGTVELSRFL